MAYLNDTKILTILKPSYLNVDDDVVSFMTNEYNKSQDTEIGEIVHINQLEAVEDAKQDTISDLATIRQGASKGATAVQDNNYVHTDNNYTTTEKQKLAGLSNYDDTEVRGDISNLESDVQDVGIRIDDIVNRTGTTVVNRANADGSGNNIVNTYATKVELTNGIDTAKSYIEGYINVSYMPKSMTTTDFDYLWNRG